MFTFVPTLKLALISVIQNLEYVQYTPFKYNVLVFNCCLYVYIGNDRSSCPLVLSGIWMTSSALKHTWNVKLAPTINLWRSTVSKVSKILTPLFSGTYSGLSMEASSVVEIFKTFGQPHSKWLNNCFTKYISNSNWLNQFSCILVTYTEMLLLRLDLIWQLAHTSNNSSIGLWAQLFWPSWAIHIPWDKSYRLESPFIAAAKLSKFGPDWWF